MQTVFQNLLKEIQSTLQQNSFKNQDSVAKLFFSGVATMSAFIFTNFVVQDLIMTLINQESFVYVLCFFFRNIFWCSVCF